jgi:hypothetical protein
MGGGFETSAGAVLASFILFSKMVGVIWLVYGVVLFRDRVCSLACGSCDFPMRRTEMSTQLLGKSLR